VHNQIMDGAIKPNNNLNMEYIMSARTKKTVDSVALTVAFSFADGGARIYDANELSAEMLNRLIVHGLSQKLGDSYAGKNDHEDCTEAMWGQLLEGNWGAERGSGLEGKLEEAQEALDNYDAMTDDEKRTVAKLGMSRLMLTKAISAIEKAIKTRDAKK